MSNRKMTDRMLETLMECHEKQLMNLDPLEASTTPHCKGLINRKMLEVKQHVTKNGKRIYGLFITDLGRDYLKKI